MAKVKNDSGALPAKTRVVATRPLIGVPEGTPGRIELVIGLTWIRYWVHFDNGVWFGPVDTAAVVEEHDWPDYQRRRQAESEAAAQRASEAPEPTAAPAEAPAADEGDATTSKIPAALLARSQAAKAKKAAAGQ